MTIVQCLLGSHNAIKAEINDKDNWQIPRLERLNNALPNNTWGEEEIPGEIKNYFEVHETEAISTCGIEQKQRWRELYTVECLY